MPNRGFWRRPWVEIELPNRVNPQWTPAGWVGLLDLGDVNHDGVNDLWTYSHPFLICYAGGKYLDSYIDGIVTVPGTEFISAAYVGDISGTGRPALAIGYDWIPHDYVDPFPGGVLFVRTDTSFVTNRSNPRRLPTTTSAVPGADMERPPALAVYPNPAHERVTIAWGRPIEEGAQLTIVNVLGEEVYTMTPESGSSGTELDLRALPAGSYRLRLRTTTSTRSTMMMRF